MITANVLDLESTLPLIIEPEAPLARASQVETLIASYRYYGDAIEKALLKNGAILFRGFGVNTPSAFARFVRSASQGLLSYVDGNSPRKKITQGVYTSTEYPAQYHISLHNELSYAHAWPSRLYFCCITAPAQGGETPVADSRKIIQRLDPRVVEEFTRRGVKYIRNLHGGQGFGPSWQDTFETSDKAVVAEYCRASAMDAEWKADGVLRLSHVRPATAVHPKTGERVWFNQADQFHPSTHPRDVYESLMALCDGVEENLPQYACFGDDTPIEAAMLDEIRETTREAASVFPWREGDVLVVENMLACHGRMPYTGPRKILVSMS